jgi:hypothetical protein
LKAARLKIRLNVKNARGSKDGLLTSNNLFGGFFWQTRAVPLKNGTDKVRSGGSGIRP